MLTPISHGLRVVLGGSFQELLAYCVLRVDSVASGKSPQALKFRQVFESWLIDTEGTSISFFAAGDLFFIYCSNWFLRWLSYIT